MKADENSGCKPKRHFKMTFGMEVILIIVVQLLVVLLVIRPFFPNALGKYKTMDEKADRVIENLTNK
jgi:ABC-type cobalt transport system substrate-binding protein